MSKIPILFLAYNRLECTKKSLNSILRYKPNNIYISCDGPKNKGLDKKKTAEVRNFIVERTKKIKGARYIFNKKNLGCKKSNIKAINWFFKNEKYGIILEDDCVANLKFFHFCKLLLLKYKLNKKIYCISGSNFQANPIDKYSYYFSKYNHCWGWATWRDRWKENDEKIKFWKKFKETEKWKKTHLNNIELKYWEKIFDKVYCNKIDSWAYPWTLCVWKKSGLTITPNMNLVKNIGVGESSTHSHFKTNIQKYLNRKQMKIKIFHPKKISLNDKADLYVFKNHFMGYKYIWPYRGIEILKKLIKNPILFFEKMKKL